MCTHQKLIYPRFSKRPMYVKCGKCPACQQEKAAKRVRRINDTKVDSLICFMVTLTYSQGTAPYVLRSDAYDFSLGLIDKLNIYRDCEIRKVRKVLNYDDYAQIYKRKNHQVILDSIDFCTDTNLLGTKDLKHEFGKIGVCFYKDYQHFIARLRLNLKRHYGYDGKLFVYACSELGTKSLRPHFHLLLFCENSIQASLRAAVIESWPFSNLSRFPRAIERCFKGASYVASYVNQSSKFPPFFKTYCKQKHSYSKGFGLSNKKYSLSYILEKFESGYLKYSVAKVDKGIPRIFDVPFPSYVINRFFPKFKGYTRCAPREIFTLMYRIVRGFTQNEYYDPKVDQSLLLPSDVSLGYQFGTLYYTNDELHKIRVRLLNAFERFKANAPEGYSLLLEDYLQLHINIWNCYNSSILRLHLSNPDIPWFEKYDNLDFVISRFLPINGKFGFDSLREYEQIKETDPNKFKSVIWNTYVYETSFHEHIKHKDVANSIYLTSADCEL